MSANGICFEKNKIANFLEEQITAQCMLGFDNVKNEIKIILLEFGINSYDDLENLSEDELCELYKNLKSSIIEQYEFSDEQIDELLNDII